MACARLADSGRVMARPTARLDRMMRFMVFSLVGMKHIVHPQCGEIMEGARACESTTKHS